MRVQVNFQSTNQDLDLKFREYQRVSVGTENIKLQQKTATPSKYSQSIIPDSGYNGLSKVTINSIPDEYVIPNGTLNITANGTYDVTEKSDVVVLINNPGFKVQEKTVDPSTSAQSVTPDGGYDGLSKVTVNAVQTEEKTAAPSISSQTITPTSGKFLSKVTVGAMPIATQAIPGITVSTDGLITASATQSAGYVASGTKSATKQLSTQAAKTLTPSTSEQTAVESGRYTTGAVKVAAVSTQTKTATPKATSQDVTPDSGKFLSKVTVNAIPSTYIQPSGTKTITSNGTHDVKSYASVSVEVADSGGADVSGVTAIAADVLAGKIIVDADGNPVTGTMTNNGSVNGTINGLTDTSFTIPVGYTSGGVVSLTSDIETALAAI